MLKVYEWLLRNILRPYKSFQHLIKWFGIFIRAKTNKTESRKRKKKKKAESHLPGPPGPAEAAQPKGAGSSSPSGQAGGSSPPVAAWLPGSCLAAPRPPFSVVETPVFIPFLIPPLEPSFPSLLCVP